MTAFVALTIIFGCGTIWSLVRSFEAVFLTFLGPGGTLTVTVICFLFVTILGFGESFLAYYRGSDLIIKSLGARFVMQGHNPSLDQVVEDMATASSLPRPAVYQINLDTLNACAIGRDAQNAAIVVTLGTATLLEPDEFRAVIAQEMVRIKNGDILSDTTLAALVGGGVRLWQIPFQWLSDSAVQKILSYALGGIVLSVSLLWLFGFIHPDTTRFPYYLLLVLAVCLYSARRRLLQVVFLRNRQYLTDRLTVELTGSPEGLINAFDKLRRSSNIIVSASVATAPLFIEYPKYRGQRPLLLKIQPLIETRIEELKHLPEFPVKVQNYASEGVS